MWREDVKGGDRGAGEGRGREGEGECRPFTPNLGHGREGEGWVGWDGK